MCEAGEEEEVGTLVLLEIQTCNFQRTKEMVEEDAAEVKIQYRYAHYKM